MHLRNVTTEMPEMAMAAVRSVETKSVHAAMDVSMQHSASSVMTDKTTEHLHLAAPHFVDSLEQPVAEMES